MKETVLVLDYGSQYTQLIARRIRELNVYSEIRPYSVSIEEIKDTRPKAIILSGGPSSVWDECSPSLDVQILELGIPILGICYGMQLLVHVLDGKVERSNSREFGPAEIEITNDSNIFFKIPNKISVWMSHGDRVLELPNGYSSIASSKNSPVASMMDRGAKTFGIQFHAEVVHTKHGKEILSNFIFKIAKCSGTWTPKSFAENAIGDIRETVGNSHVLCAISGGIDSTVTALIIQRAIRDRLHCIFVDTGLLRLNEAKEVVDAYKDMGLSMTSVDAKERFLKRLKGVKDPEEKRKIIGEEFIRVFEEVASGIAEAEYLAQGTLYPDVIESISVKGPSSKIKSHHNVGGLPDRMNLKLVEPLRELFKDEVRDVGRELGLTPEILGRHPFPGPGLAIRIIGEVEEQKLVNLRQADAIFVEEIKNAGIYDDIWQAFCVLLPVQTVGVMGDERTYESVVALRAVTSVDGMTANWARIPSDILEKVSVRIINEVKGINRVVYDISTKPPGTIEWE